MQTLTGTICDKIGPRGYMNIPHSSKTNRDYAFDRAFTDLNEALTALRRLLVTFQHLGIIKKEALQPLFKNLQRKYVHAHMIRQFMGDLSPEYLPQRRSED